VLLHSSLPEAALKEKAKSSGAHGYIRKTSNQIAFLREVTQWLRQAPPTLARSTSGTFDSATGQQKNGTQAAWSSDASMTAVSGTRLAPQTVLLVDSDMVSLSNHRKQLQSESLVFEFALSSAHALACLTGKSPPDLVVSNSKIGDANGVQLYERALAHDSRWRTRFIFFADRSADDALTASSFRGPMLFKPVQIEDLKNAIRSTLGPRTMAASSVTSQSR
jgi:CheY-like chemotaxis protein